MISESIVIVVCIAWVIVWIMSEHSPFWWSAMAFLFLEAVRREMWMCVWPAARIFARRVSRRFASVRQEIGVAA